MALYQIMIDAMKKTLKVKLASLVLWLMAVDSFSLPALFSVLWNSSFTGSSEVFW